MFANPKSLLGTIFTFENFTRKMSRADVNFHKHLVKRALLISSSCKTGGPPS